MENCNEKKYFIIAGTNKAATTSFYEYLAAHPQICSSYVKQTFFFLDKNWQEELKLYSLYDYEKGVQQYNNFFRDCNEDQFRLEASPEYLYAPETPRRLYSFYSERKGNVIFILRNPVTRFVSLFYFGKQQGIISSQCTFSEFIKANQVNPEKKNTSLIALETGFYSKYLERYVELFGKENIKVYFFEDLMTNPLSLMKRVSEEIGIDANFYNSFKFQTHNKTVKLRSRFFARLYNVPRAVFIKTGFRSKFGFAIAQALKKTITPLYRKFNTAPLEKQTVDPNDINYVEEIYKNEKYSLEKLLGIHVPW